MVVLSVISPGTVKLKLVGYWSSLYSYDAAKGSLSGKPLIDNCPLTRFSFPTLEGFPGSMPAPGPPAWLDRLDDGGNNVPGAWIHCKFP